MIINICNINTIFLQVFVFTSFGFSYLGYNHVGVSVL